VLSRPRLGSCDVWCVGKTSTAAALSEHYDVPVLTLDDVIIASVQQAMTVHGQRARQLCADAATRRLQRPGDVTESLDDTVSTHTTHGNNTSVFSSYILPSVLRHCWLGVMKSIQPVKS